MMDVQKTCPKNPFPLNKVGITEKKCFFTLPDKRKILIHVNAKVDLDIKNKGIHMSRNVESIQETLNYLAENYDVELTDVAKVIAEKLLDCHEYSTIAEVDIEANIDYETKTPATKRFSQEIATLILKSKSVKKGNKKETTNIQGIKLYGMSACPCGQKMAEEQASLRLKNELGFSYDNIKKILDVIPIATHNQRCTIEALIETKNGFNLDINKMIGIINNSFSSETYGLLKRHDEFAVIDKAHKNPLFVEDSTRRLVLSLLNNFGQQLSNDSRITIIQENFESIHKHNAFVEFNSSIGEIKEKMGNYLLFED